MSLNNLNATPKLNGKVGLKNVLFFIFLFSMVFDYRRSEIDSSLFIVFLSMINVFCGSLLILLINEYKKSVLYIAFFPMLFIVTSIFSGIMREQSIYNVFSQILPAIIFFQSVLIFSSYFNEISNFNNGLKLIILASIFSGIFKVFFAFTYLDLDLENMRYQIISGATILLFSYGVSCYLVEKRNYMFLALLLSLGVVFVSITRTYILVFLISTLLTALVMPAGRIKANIFKGTFLLFIIIILLFLLNFVFPAVGDRWLDRIFSYQNTGGDDVTSLTRIAEIKGQIAYMKKDILGFLFGFGAASSTEWSGLEMQNIYYILGVNAESEGINYGHNVYVGIIYVGGILAGLPFIFNLFYIPIKGYLKLKFNYKILSNDERFLAVFSICSVIGYSLYGFLGGTFGDRSMSLYYGISFGLLLYFIYYIKRKSI